MGPLQAIAQSGKTGEEEFDVDPITRDIPAKQRVRLAALGAAPKQRGRTLLIEEVDAHRNLYCAHYDTCLDAAIAANWVSFSCAACPYYANGVNCSGTGRPAIDARQGGEGVVP